MIWFANYCGKINAKLAMIQEHFKISSNATGYFRKIFIDHNIYYKKAERKEGEIRGRGSGGLLQMSCKVTDMSLSPINTTLYRLQEQKLRLRSKTILWFNIYFPNDGVDTEELTALLTDMELITDCEGVKSIMVAGNLNYDAVRTFATANIIREWIEKMDLNSIWDHYPIDFIHHHIDHSSMAILDYFLVTSDLLNIVSSVGVHHHPEEYSCHDPIWVKLDLGQLKVKSMNSVNKRKPGWNEATYEDINNYINMLSNKLKRVVNTEGMVCEDTKCYDAVHGNEIDHKVLNVLTGIVESSYSCIPIVGRDEIIHKKNKKKLPNYYTEMKPFRSATIYWHDQWVNTGRKCDD